MKGFKAQKRIENDSPLKWKKNTQLSSRGGGAEPILDSIFIIFVVKSVSWVRRPAPFSTLRPGGGE